VGAVTRETPSRGEAAANHATRRHPTRGAGPCEVSTRRCRSPVRFPVSAVVGVGGRQEAGRGQRRRWWRDGVLSWV